MTESELEAARRVVTIPEWWRWMPGMADAEGHRVLLVRAIALGAAMRVHTVHPVIVVGTEVLIEIPRPTSTGSLFERWVIIAEPGGPCLKIPDSVRIRTAPSLGGWCVTDTWAAEFDCITEVGRLGGLMKLWLETHPAEET